MSASTPAPSRGARQRARCDGGEVCLDDEVGRRLVTAQSSHSRAIVTVEQHRAGRVRQIRAGDAEQLGLGESSAPPRSSRIISPATPRRAPGAAPQNGMFFGVDGCLPSPANASSAARPAPRPPRRPSSSADSNYSRSCRRSVPSHRTRYNREAHALPRAAPSDARRRAHASFQRGVRRHLRWPLSDLKQPAAYAVPRPASRWCSSRSSPVAVRRTSRTPRPTGANPGAVLRNQNRAAAPRCALA